MLHNNFNQNCGVRKTFSDSTTVYIINKIFRPQNLFNIKGLSGAIKNWMSAKECKTARRELWL